MTDYTTLCEQLRALTDGVPHKVANLANASALLWQSLHTINWAGFYIVREDKNLRKHRSLAYLLDGIGAIHKHSDIVGQDKVALCGLTDAEELLARGGGDKKGLNIGQKPSDQSPELGVMYP